jgi:hypothetical protein
MNENDIVTISENNTNNTPSSTLEKLKPGLQSDVKSFKDYPDKVKEGCDKFTKARLEGDTDTVNKTRYELPQMRDKLMKVVSKVEDKTHNDDPLAEDLRAKLVKGDETLYATDLSKLVDNTTTFDLGQDLDDIDLFGGGE